MKMELQQQLKAPVFLDSDNLEDLDMLLDTLRCKVQNLVVLLTSQTLHRPWCAGEVATSWKNGIPMIPIHIDGYIDPSADELTVERISNRWSAEEFASCQRNGISNEIVCEAFAHLQQLPKVYFDRVKACHTGEKRAFVQMVTVVAAKCSSSPKAVKASSSEVEESTREVPSAADEDDATMSPGPKISSMSTAEWKMFNNVELAIVANSADAEAISAAEVIVRLVSQATQWQTVELLVPADVDEAIEAQVRPPRVLVLLTEGALTSQVFSETLLRAVRAWGGRAKMLPVGTEQFVFPSAQAIDETIAPQVSKMISNTREEIAIAYKRLFKTIAARFHGMAGLSTLMANVDVMLERFERQQARVSNKSEESALEDSP